MTPSQDGIVGTEQLVLVEAIYSQSGRVIGLPIDDSAREVAQIQAVDQALADREIKEWLDWCKDRKNKDDESRKLYEAIEHVRNKSDTITFRTPEEWRGYRQALRDIAVRFFS